LDNRVSKALSLLLVCIVLASGAAIHDGFATRSLIETLAVVALAFVGIAARANDVNLAARSTHGLKIAAAVPACWMIIQLLPTPIGAYSIWAYANEALGQRSWGHISIDLGGTILALSFYLANISLILVCVFVAKDRRRAELVLFALTAITAITALGLLVGKSGLIATVGDTNDVLGGVGALGILLSLATLLRTFERYETEAGRPAEPARNIRTGLIASAIGLIVNLVGLGVSATLNEGLIVIIGVLTLGSVPFIRRFGPAGWGAAILIATMTVGTAMIILWRYDSTRALSPFLQFVSGSSPDAISVTQRLLNDTRWLGTGAGTFAAVLPIYQDFGSLVSMPPSTISGLAIELGLPVTLFIVAMSAWITVTLYRGALSRGRDSFYPAAAAGGTLVLLGGAFCDPSLLNSCVAVIGDVLIGLGLAQSVSGRDSP
jgi:hypothetical protein